MQTLKLVEDHFAIPELNLFGSGVAEVFCRCTIVVRWSCGWPIKTTFPLSIWSEILSCLGHAYHCHLTCGWRVWCLMSLQTIPIPKVAIPTDNYADGIFNFVPSSAINFVQVSHGVSTEFADPLLFRCRRGWIATRSHPKCRDLTDLVPQQRQVHFPQPTAASSMRVPFD